MNLSKLFKSISFLSTLIVIIFIAINNQKQSTKLKILIWDTPVLSLGSYLAISSGTGFLISYFMTNVITYNNISKVDKINYKYTNKQEEYNERKDSRNNISYDNTLIERDIKDPSPTINASFRVISKRTKAEERSSKNIERDYETSDYLNETDNIYYEEQENYESIDENKLYINDWFDDSHEKW